MNFFKQLSKRISQKIIFKSHIKKRNILKPILLISLYNYYNQYYQNKTSFCWMEALNYKLNSRKKFYVFTRYLKANRTIEDKYCYGNLKSQNIFYACIFDGHGGCQIC